MTIALAGMVALAVPMGIGRFALTPILPMMQIDAGVSIADGGWLASANDAGTLFGAVCAGLVSVPAAPAVRGGMLVIGLTTLAMAVAGGLPSWIVLRALAGFATAWVLVFASAWSLARLAPLRRPALNSTVFAGYGVGIAGAGLVCLALMRAHASSANAWAVLGALARAVRGAGARGLIGALASAFAVGQIVALVAVSVAARAGRGFQDALVVSAMLLVGERSGPAL